MGADSFSGLFQETISMEHNPYDNLRKQQIDVTGWAKFSRREIPNMGRPEMLAIGPRIEIKESNIFALLQIFRLKFNSRLLKHLVGK